LKARLHSFLRKVVLELSRDPPNQDHSSQPSQHKQSFIAVIVNRLHQKS
jgi:hypothetical protein